MRVSAQEGHRLWAASYDTTPNPLLALETRLLAGAIGPVASRRVIDVACGTGRWLGRFIAWGAAVIGVDSCAEMLERAQQTADAILILADATALPIRSAVADLTICSFAAAYFGNLERGISEMGRITKRGGRVIISDMHPAAVASGWTRSFRAGGVVYEMEYSGYSLAQIGRAAAKAGLDLETEVHGRFGEPERAAFESAGKADRFDEVSQTPAVWIGSWRNG